MTKIEMIRAYEVSYCHSNCTERCMKARSPQGDKTLCYEDWSEASAAIQEFLDHRLVGCDGEVIVGIEVVTKEEWDSWSKVEEGR